MMCLYRYLSWWTAKVHLLSMLVKVVWRSHKAAAAERQTDVNTSLCKTNVKSVR